ncbi:YhgE/Pip C-terminal domain protein [Ethanoligenens harbinense YUAN-3]|uniref:YhgE/Pip C-terminal domain protein n=1 Tax=Ethanoligenens harbinense (strain DSM 18485 / JCM 12961 / CGMCC 1.5033 / YUAN-3) TaxID=663278 RepID=E6U8C0_ETHHY|nr:YhgE/Pip C-terminal domain protein [Ethanoligenens harbinense YUAN-3]AVQ97234.1 YhgE/Pip domain-containing protein [Ethanoligenens harbinense YUAN-3]AYF39899.1 YhgE/Pip domain-containing protein [Ethanoligenens harbinense]AYF42729.1 YhgE/Pip domain-containing protein [Ethanoligenens harbinense]QCN93479.1 YhgE/Pip domain-containing protein [Ethanoligenens harbinense]
MSLLRKHIPYPRIVVILLGVTIIPILYSFFYLWAFWDPYGNLSKIPVAVVNDDKGASINNEQRNLGGEMVRNMKKSDDLKWVFLDNDADARAGVEAGNYYSAVFIPETFSADIASASTTDKKTPVIQYLSNEKNNYTASKIISSAMTRLEEQTRMSVDQSITASLSDKLRATPASLQTLHNGLSQLSDGANALSSGIGQAQSGAAQVASGASTLGSGLQTLGNGANSLASGASQAASGAAQVASGAASLNTGLQALNTGAQSLSSGTNQAAGGAAQVANGAASLNTGLQTLNTGAQSLSSGVNDAAGGAAQVSSGAAALQQQFVSQFTPGVNQLSDGLARLLAALQITGSTSNPTLADSITQLDNGLAQLQSQFQTTGSTTSPTLADSIGQLNTGAQSYSSLAAGTLYAGTASTFAALQSASNGNTALAQQLTAGVLQSYRQQAAAALYTYATTNSTDALNNAAVFVSLYDAAAVIAGNPSISETDFVSALAKGGSYTFSASDLPADEQAAGAQIAGTVNSQIVPSLNQNNVVAAGQTLAAGTSKLAAQFRTSGNPSSPSLYDNINSLKAGMDALAAQLKSGGNTATLYDNVKNLSDGAAAIAAQTKTSGDASNPTLYDGISQLASGSSSLNGGLISAASGASQLAAGTASAASGGSSLSSGAAQLSAGMPALASGANQLAAGLSGAAAGSASLSSGAAQLSTGIPALASGANQLAAGTASAISGSGSLTTGAQQLLAGFSPLRNGVAELANGLSSATQGVSDSLADANIQIQSLNGLDRYASAPLKVQSASVYHVPNYGIGFAPYFISISLWAGALMMIAGLQLGKGKPGSPLEMRRFAMLRVAFYYVMAFLQGVVLSVVLPLTLHFQVQNMPLYMLTNILVAFTFVSVILFCVTSLGIFGSFISVVLLVLQLTSSAGTFPLETTPKFFQVISPLLPMTYSVRLLREVISGFHGNYAAYDVAYLLAVLAAMFSLIVIVTHFKTSREISRAEDTREADMELPS